MSDVRFVTVGDIMTDVVARTTGPLRHGSDTAADITAHPGGAAGNTAAWLAQFGHRAAVVGRVGDDVFGRNAHERLAEDGVEVHLGVDPSRATGTVIVVVDITGERTMLPDAGANDLLSPDDLPDHLFARGRHLHLSGYTLLRDGSRMAGLAALDLARLRGMTASVDPASAGPIDDVGREVFLGWCEGADVLLANELEVTALTGVTHPVEAARLLTARFGAVVVKLGAQGAAWVSNNGEVVTSPAVAVSVLDTTGAGDAFAAGFLPSWADGRPPAECLAEGNLVASHAVSRVGARP